MLKTRLMPGFVSGETNRIWSLQMIYSNNPKQNDRSRRHSTWADQLNQITTQTKSQRTSAKQRRAYSGQNMYCLRSPTRALSR